MATVNQMQVFGITFDIPEPNGSERRLQPPAAYIGLEVCTTEALCRRVCRRGSPVHPLQTARQQES